jgi:hypothetical protein
MRTVTLSNYERQIVLELLEDKEYEIKSRFVDSMQPRTDLERSLLKVCEDLKNRLS